MRVCAVWALYAFTYIHACRMEGEVCNGIAYFRVSRLNNSNEKDSSLFTKCFGRLNTFKFPNIDEHNVKNQSEGKYIRSIGSTAIVKSVDGRCSAHSLGPIDAYAVEIGPLEEAIVDLAIRANASGITPTFIEPTKVLFKRAELIAKKSMTLFKDAVFPLSNFAHLMKLRIPQLVKESYSIASSVKIEVEFKNNDS